MISGAGGDWMGAETKARFSFISFFRRIPKCLKQKNVLNPDSLSMNTTF